jgi:hypothetical protein
MVLWGVLLTLGVLAVTGSVSVASWLEQRKAVPAQSLVDLAKADLAQRLQVMPDAIAVQDVEAVEFADSSLSVPEPDQMYLTVITPGYVINLASGAKIYEYHGAGDRVVLAAVR